jgi:hypothetical protein
MDTKTKTWVRGLIVALALGCLSHEGLAASYGKLNGGGGGGLSTVVADGVTINGNGTSGTPLSGVPASASNAGTMSATDKKFVDSSKTWAAAMLAYAQANVSASINKVAIVVDFNQGIVGDYQNASMLGSGAVTMDTARASSVLMDSTIAGTGNTSGLVPKNGPILITAVTTQPWMVASRCLNVTGGDATGSQIMIDPTSGGSGFAITRPYFGMIGASSTSFYTFVVSGATKMVTSVALNTTVAHDAAVGFNGSTTLSAHFGDVLAGNLASVATSTDLTGLGAGTGQPGAAIVGGAARVQMSCDVVAAFTVQ